ncbi:hypothetical protein V8C43DRAFT_278135, partial [Trichoderma afarasin]
MHKCTHSSWHHTRCHTTASCFFATFLLSSACLRLCVVLHCSIARFFSEAYVRRSSLVALTQATGVQASQVSFFFFFLSFSLSLSLYYYYF